MGTVAELLEKLVGASRGLPGVRRDLKRKATLRELLEEEKFKWRGVDTLARSIGASEEKTRELLVSIGARASVARGAEVWGLKSRVDRNEPPEPSDQGGSVIPRH